MVTARYVAGWFVAVCILHGTPLWAQTLFPERGMRAIEGLYRGVNPQDDTARRVAIKRVCEQMQFDLGENWGNKKRTGLSDAFLSPDSIAYLENGGTVSVWDVQASSGQILVHAGKPADHPNIPPGEATFMDCDPVNHLGGGQPQPPTPPADHDHASIEARLAVIETAFRVTEAELRAILAMLTDLVNGLDQRAAVDRERIERLEARPIPLMGCRAAIAGIPISCRLQ